MSRNANPTAMLKKPRLPSTLTGLTVGKVIVAAVRIPSSPKTRRTTRLMTSAKFGRSSRQYRRRTTAPKSRPSRSSTRRATRPVPARGRASPTVSSTTFSSLSDDLSGLCPGWDAARVTFV